MITEIQALRNRAANQAKNGNYWAAKTAAIIDRMEALKAEIGRENNPTLNIHDIDGYCVCCGCGEWRKGHHPGCSIGELIERVEDLKKWAPEGA